MNQLSKNNSTILFILLTGVLIVVAFISHTKISQHNKSVENMIHINEIKTKILNVLSQTKDAEIEQRSFLLMGDTIFLHSFKNGQHINDLNLAELDSLIKDDQQQENLSQLKALVSERYSILYNNLLLNIDKYPPFYKDSALMAGKLKMDDVRAQITLMLQKEDKLLADHTQFNDRTSSITPISLLILSLFSILVISIFFFRLQKETNERISITESNLLLQQAKDQIETSEKRFRTLTETIPHMTWTATPDGTKNFFNKFFMNYTGLTFEELKGDGWQKVVHPDDRDRELSCWQIALKTGKEFQIEKRVLHHNGEYRWHIARAVAQRDKGGNIIGWIGTSTEIEEQKCFTEELENKVKERTQELLIQNQTFEIAEKIAILGSYKWNITTNELEYSNNLFRLLDCEPQEFIPTTEKFLSFIHPDDLQKVIHNQEKTIQQRSLVEAPYRIISKTGVIKYFRSSGTISGEGDNCIFIGTVQDISKDVEASKELQVKNKELENANAELASFNYIASHDLQEPLRKIQGFSKRIISEEENNLSDKAKDYFNRINAAAKRMQNLISSVLSYSRTNNAKLVFEKTNLNEVLREVELELYEIIELKKAVIDIPILPTIHAIPAQMHQLFLNLVSNSLKYSKNDVVPIIRITAEKVILNDVGEQLDGNSTYWKITINDNGIGFEQQYENKIFEVFQRLHGKTAYEGTGIGLAICKKIIQAHQGTISAIGEPGIGSTFIIILPMNEIV